MVTSAYLPQQPFVQNSVRRQIGICRRETFRDQLLEGIVFEQIDDDTHRLAQSFTVKGLRQVVIIQDRLLMRIGRSESDFARTDGKYIQAAT